MQIIAIGDERFMTLGVVSVDCGYNTVGMVAVDEAKQVSDLLNEFENK